MSSSRLVVLMLFVLSAAACRSVPTSTASAPSAAPAIETHENLNAVLWMQTSAEYEAAVRGVYAAARSSLDRALSDTSWSALPEGERGDGFETLPPAIIVDADETMIDNSPFQARHVRDGTPFSGESWEAWVNERRALAMPGAVDFANEVQRRGVAVYFITNRDAPAETDSTIANLRALGFPIAADGSNVLLRGDARGPGREKSARRRWVAGRHRVVLMLGDNLGDFMDGVSATIAQRQALIAPYADWWGVRWFMQPNPSYGSWESALPLSCQANGAGAEAGGDPTGCKRSLLRYQ